MSKLFDLQRTVPYIVITVAVVCLSSLIWVLVSATPTVQASVIAGLLGFGAALLSQMNIKKRERESRLHEMKLEAYGRLLSILFELFQKQKSVNSSSGSGGSRKKRKSNMASDNELTQAMLTCKKEFMLWSNSDFINKWNQFETSYVRSEENPDDDSSSKLMLLDSLIRSIRKELGHDDRNLRDGDLVAVILVEDEKTQILSRAGDKTA